MRDQFILDLKRHFSAHSFTEMRASSTHLYVQEISKFDESDHFIRCTVLTETVPTERHFKVSNNSLIFLELKVEQEDATFEKEDKPKWKAFFEGLTQIEDFVNFLRNNSFEVKDYFKTVKAVICMRFEPKLVSNTKRNTELYKRSMAIGFFISPPHNHEYYFEL